MKKIAVVGSRSIKDARIVEGTLDFIVSKEGAFEVISGGAIGVDTLAVDWAKRKGYNVTVILPNWKDQGRAAGFIRNAQIVEYADEVIAFWDGESRGTLDTIRKAVKADKPVYVEAYYGGQLLWIKDGRSCLEDEERRI